MDAITVLSDFAQRNQLRLKPCTIFYLAGASPATTRARIARADRSYEVMASSSHLVLRAKQEMPVFFSVGEPAPMLLTVSRLDPQVRGSAFYVRDGFQDDVMRWLSQPRNLAAIEAIRLKPHESLHVARNETILVSIPERGVDDAIETFDHFLSVVAVSAPYRAPTNRRLLPSIFSDLELVARDWAIDDDVEREEAILRLSEADRRRLARIVTPRLADINKYLSALSGSERDGEQAGRLHALGELGAELAIASRREGNQDILD